MGDESITRRYTLAALGTFSVATASGVLGANAILEETDAQRQQIRTGTLTLEFGDPGSLEIYTGNLAPTQSVSGTLELVNGGATPGVLSLTVRYEEMDATHTSGNRTDRSADELARAFEVSELTYGGDSLLEAGGDLTTLYDLAVDGENSPPTLTGVPGPGMESGTTFSIELTYKDVGNTYQNDGLRVTFRFTLTQATEDATEGGT